MICAFFGHRDTVITDELENTVTAAVRKVISFGADEFWVCGQGNFDWLSRTVMRKIQSGHPYIRLCYVCAYNPDKLPGIKRRWLEERYEIIYPESAAAAPRRYAIEKRNKYIAENADYIICYIKDKSGGAAKAVGTALKNGKTVINTASGFA